MIGACGAHRCGKTTLAQAFAEQHNIPFVRTSGTEVFALIGKDPKVDYPIEDRIVIQEAILFAFERQYAAARSMSPVWISDRTPIDLASYMLADVKRGTFAGQPGLAEMVNGYVSRCIEATNQWFSTVVLVQPGIKLVEEAGKAPACPAFIEHLNALQLGLLLDERLLSRHYMIPRKVTDLTDRVDAVKNAVECSNKAIQMHRQNMKDAGVHLH